MEYVALTGMSEHVISELRHEHLLTIEVRSPHNFFGAYGSKVGDLLFLTHISFEDLKVGTMGILAKIINHHVLTYRTLQSNSNYCEEREATLLRIQLEPRYIARVMRVACNELCAVQKVDAEKLPCFNAR